MTTFDRVISLGPTCETKLNLVRILRLREGSKIPARRVQAHPKNAPSSVFDWQVTPEAALLEYFRHNFRGMFERDDLVRTPKGWLMNARFRTHHPHEFGPYNDDVDALLKRYPEAKARHDYLCDKLRAMLASPAPTLFVRSVVLSDAAREELTEQIRARSGGARFEFLTVPTDPVSDAAQWPENHALWDAAFRNVSFALPPRDRAPPSLHALSFGARRFVRHLRKMRF